MTTGNSRSLKVRAQSGYMYKPTPTIILKGQWLKNLGFDIDDPIRVECENGKLTVTLDMAREEAAEQVVAVLDGNGKKNRRYQKKMKGAVDSARSGKKKKISNE